MKIEMQLVDQRLGKSVDLPQYATRGSAGVDLRAMISTSKLTIFPDQVLKIPTGVKFNMGEGVVGMLYPRSGLGVNHGIILANGTGVIDSDYQGEIIVALWNRSKNPYEINCADKIAQIVFLPVIQAELELVESFTPTERGEGGFGSTGKA